MTISLADFWKLLADSRLLALDQLRELAQQFERLPPQQRKEGAVAAARWLVQQHAVTRYQARVLLAGRNGPFFYGDYKLQDRVESGGLAGWFRAQHLPTGHPVLLRFATGTLLTDPGQWAAAEHAVAVASRLNFPHLQRYFEAVDLRTHRFVVSEDLQGQTLQERMQRGPLPASEACRIARLVALALAQLHAAGRAHGALRPAQVLLEPLPGHPDHVRLLFDALKCPGPVDWTADPNELAAHADYLAPELLTAGRSPDASSDLYALGCVLYAMLSGRPPFPGGSVQQKMARHTAEAIRPLEASQVPPPLMQLLTYFLAKSPAVRLPSALVAAEQLALFVEPAALAAPVPGPPPTLPAFELALRMRPTPSSTPGAEGPTTPPLASAPPPLAAPFLPASPAGMPAAAAAVPLAPPPGPPPLGMASPTVSAPVGWSPPAPEGVPATAGGPAVAVAIQAPGKPRPTRSAQEILRLRRQQQKRRMLLGLAGSVALLVGGLAGYFVYRQRPPAPQVAAGTSAEVNPTAVPPVLTDQTKGHPTNGELAATGSSAAPGSRSSTSPGSLDTPLEVVPDDGQLLWAAPTGGPPLTFVGVPPEAQLFLYLRPAELWATEEGQRVFQALGPELEAVRRAWETASGFSWVEIESLLLTLHNNAGQFPRVHMVVTPRERLSLEQLLARWGQPTSEAGYYRRGPWAFYPLPGEAQRGVFAMGHPDDVKEVVAAEGRPPPVFREIERLRRFTDTQRQFTLLCYPQFFFNDDGEPLFAGPAAKLRPSLAWLLGEHLQAACLSGHLGERLYLELRMLPSLDQEAYQLASALRERLNQVPAALEDYLLRLDPPAYWKKLAFRVPAMVRELHSYLRIGVEHDQAVVNSVLPSVAAHNLVLAGELLLQSEPGTVAVAAAPASRPTGPQTIEEALQLRTTFSFAAQSLEFAMRDLAEEVQGNLKGTPVEFAIKILGSDLEKEGITRNQTIRDFRQENQTVADILTALVRKANPITTVQDPSELDQKLIWVLGPDPDQPNRKIVLITTRAAAAERNDALPPPFVPKVAGKKKTK